MLLPIPSFQLLTLNESYTVEDMWCLPLIIMRGCCGLGPVHLLSLFLRHCISVFHCSLTNVRLQPALIKSNMRRPWPLCEGFSKCPGNKWDIWKGWVHMEWWGSGAALWAPSFSFASSDLIDLNLKKNGVIMTKTHGREGGGQAVTSLWPWHFRESEFEEEAEAPKMLLYVLRTSDVAPWEAPIAVVENHKEASCPVMIDGETNDLWSSITYLRNQQWIKGHQRNYTQSVYICMAQTRHSQLCSEILRSLIKLEAKFTNSLNAKANCIILIWKFVIRSGNVVSTIFYFNSILCFLSCLTIQILLCTQSLF